MGNVPTRAPRNCGGSCAVIHDIASAVIVKLKTQWHVKHEDYYLYLTICVDGNFMKIMYAYGGRNPGVFCAALES